MFRYLTERAIAFIQTQLGVSILIFGAIRLVPGDAIIAMLGTEAGMLTDTQRQALEAYFGLDKPLWEQYLLYIGGAMRLDFGYSISQYPRKVTDVILEAMPWTICVTTIIPRRIAPSDRPERVQ